MARTWAGIIRVSDMNGREREADNFRSERDQTAHIRGAVPKGDKVAVLAPELDISGGLPLDKRPSLREAVEGVETGKYAGIIVAYQSRLGRDTEHEEQVWKRVEAAGGRIIMALDGIDTTTTDGRMVRRIRSAINHAERERHIDQFDRLRKALTAEGVWQTHVIPKGYRKDPKTRKLVPGPDAPLVVEAFRARARGESIARIAVLLGMSPTATGDLLRNRVYLGELRVGKHDNATAHPAIVPADLWHRAQRPKVTHTRKAGPSLLTGLVFCCGCGRAMSRTGAIDARVWSCPRVSKDGICPAPAGVNAANLEALAERIARAELARLVAVSTPADTGIAAARELRDAAVAERDHFLVNVKATSLPEGVYAKGLEVRQAAVDEAETELAEALARSARPADWARTTLDLWDEMSVAQRNVALHELLEGVAVERAGGRGGGRGPARTLDDRVRFIEHGAGVIVRGHAIALPDADAPHVLRV